MNVLGDFIGKPDAFLATVDPLELNVLVAGEIPVCRNLDRICEAAHDSYS